MTEDDLVDELLEVRASTERETEGLVEEYQDMTTISWAVRKD